jgi:glycerophosphoryl diester phosphodiesterase
MSSRPVFAVGHRGASAYAPENTVAAFDEAVRLGARAVEFDVRVSADGVAVVIHDETVDRTTTGRGRVAELGLMDLRRLDAGSWMDTRFVGTRIPTL